MNPAGQSCGNCRYFDQEAVMGEAQGKCVRFPPAIGGNAWPTVNADRWCGEWKTTTTETDRGGKPGQSR